MTPQELNEIRQVVDSALIAIQRRSDIVTPAPVVAPPSVKPAWQTSEFWGHAAVALLGLLATSGILVPNSMLAQVAGLAIIGLSQAGYSVSRGLCKMNAPKK